MLKQVNDVHTPMITQLMCVEFMKKYDIDKYIAKNRELTERNVRNGQCNGKILPTG